MNSQDFRNLQEVYNQVYQLDEGLKSIDTPEKAQKYATKALGSVAKAGFTGDKNTLNKRLTGLKMGQRKAERKAAEEVKEQYDLYDIILSHLLDEGYADTYEAAEAIMVNMGEDWRESIIETRLDPRGRPASGPMNVYANPKKPSQSHLDAVKAYDEKQKKKTPEQKQKELDAYRNRKMYS